MQAIAPQQHYHHQARMLHLISKLLDLTAASSRDQLLGSGWQEMKLLAPGLHHACIEAQSSARLPPSPYASGHFSPDRLKVSKTPSSRSFT